MSARVFVEYVNFADLALCLAAFLFLRRSRLLSDFRYLAAFIAVRFTTDAVSIPVLFFRKNLGISKHLAYQIYFYSSWPSFIIQAVLMVFVVYGIYSMALAPFEPLKKLGTIIFRWVAAISVAVSVGVAISPHMFGGNGLVNAVGQLQQTASVLTLCLLFFVCFALRPLGLTVRSRAFGASIGLGVLAATSLIQSAWIPTPSALSINSMIYFYSGLGGCAALLVWGTYFAVPEPERRMVLLPTTSPYFFWNKISEALGDKPGFVAVSGFTPDSMAPGELAAMLAASQPKVEQAPRIMQPIAVNR
jgi:hypothetical protein